MIRVLLAEPMALTREGLIAILGREHDIELVAVLSLGQGVLPAARIWLPQVALVAASFPDHDGIPLARALRAAVPGCRNYLSRAIAKTGARNRVDAIRIASERGWL